MLEYTQLRERDDELADVEFSVQLELPSNGNASGGHSEFILSLTRLGPSDELFAAFHTYGDGLAALGEFTRLGGLQLLEGPQASVKRFCKGLETFGIARRGDQ